MNLLTVTLLVALLGIARTAGPTACTSCRSPTANCQTIETVNCTKEEDSCISVEDINGLTEDHSTLSGSAKSCAVAAKHINGTLIFDFGDEGHLALASQLCSDKDCQAEFDYVLMQPFLNGKYCPKCYKPGYTRCSDNGTVSCRGDFLKCAVINGEMSEDGFKIPFAAKGCARTTYTGDINAKLPLTVESGRYTYKFVQLSFRAANGALSAMRRIAFTLDSKDLGSQLVFLFPCFLSLFMMKNFS